MSPHIIKCKTILKINERETINLTWSLNLETHGGGGEGTAAWATGRPGWVRGSARLLADAWPGLR